MGASIDVSNGYIRARAKRFRGTTVVLDQITVTGTENLMMAATLADGTTVIENAACEPEVTDLACIVWKGMGACIRGAGTRRIEIDGVQELHGATHRVLPDRIEAATYLAAGCITGGKIRANQVSPGHHGGGVAEISGVWGRDRDWGGLGGTGYARAQAQGNGCQHGCLSGLSDRHAGADGGGQRGVGRASTVTETVFENRFMHIQELVRMGADIEVHGNSAVVQGVGQLSGAPVMATDLRASASLVLAALVADGESIVDRVYHIDRGYECVEEKFQRLGATIQRLS